MNSSKLRPVSVAGYIFGRFRIDLDSYSLLRDDDALAVTPKAFDTLIVLIANRHRVVGKDELMSLLWPESFVSEDSLTQSISVLRRVLGDDPSQPQFIATSARHGYRFVAAVQEIPSDNRQPDSELPSAVTVAQAGTPVGPRRPRALVLGLPIGFAVLLIAILLMGTQAVRPVSLADRGPLRFVQEAPAGTTLASGGELSANGAYLAFVAQDNRSAVNQLWVRALDAPEPRALSGTEGAARPFWSPDNQHLAFFANGKLHTVGLDSGTPQAIASTDSTTEGGGSWSLSGVILFTVLRSGLYSVPAAGGTVAAVTSLNPVDQEVAHRWPQFLPDGRQFLFYIDSVRPERSGTYLASLDSSDRTRLLDVPAVFVQPNHLVYIRDRSLIAQPLDVSRKRVIGMPVTIAGNAVSATTTNGAVVSSASGLLSFGVSRSADRLEWFSRTGQRMGGIDSTTTLRNPALSPDGRQLLAASNADLEHKGLWIIELDRGGQTRIANDGMRPLWSPDGAQVAFTSDRAAGIADLYLRSITGNEGDEQALLKTAENKFICDWSPDGRYLVFGSINPTTKSDLWLLPLSGDMKPIPYLATPNNEIGAQISPDGKWLAYASDESGKWEVYLQGFPNANNKQTVSTGGGIEPRWRRDGRELFYLGADRTLYAVTISPEGGRISSSPPQALFRTKVPNLNVFINWYAAAPDGLRFVINTTGGTGSVQPITVLVNWDTRLNP